MLTDLIMNLVDNVVQTIPLMESLKLIIVEEIMLCYK
jgi:hypothetical protein